MHEDWIDRWKGILIFLIVLGHVLGMGESLSTGASAAVQNCLYRPINWIHVPSFFCLAGLTWSNREIAFGAFVVKKFTRLMIPYIIFGLISVLFYAVAMHVSPVKQLLTLLFCGDFVSGEGFLCNSVLWFLPAMFVSELAFYWVQRFLTGKGVVAVVVVFLVVVMLSLIVRYCFFRLPWQLAGVPLCVVYMLFGRYCLRKNPLALPCGKNLSFAIVLVLLAGLFWLDIPLPDPFQSRHQPVFGVVFILYAFAGAFLTLLLAQIVKWGFLVRMGVASLGIMVIHKFPIVFLQFKVGAMSKLYAYGPIVAIVATLFIACVVVWVSQLVSQWILKRVPWALGKSSS